LPIGLIIFTKNPENEIDVKAKYPEELEISEQIIKMLILSHQNNGSRNFSDLTTGTVKIASYYTGKESDYFITIILTFEEDPVLFENILYYITNRILKNLSGVKYKDLLPDLFKIISLYPTYTNEQKLAIAYIDETKRLTINKLVKDAYISKSDLKQWLIEKLGNKHLDLEPILTSLVKLGLIKKWVMDENSEEFVFLTGDFFVNRLPPSNLIKIMEKIEIPKDIASKYLAAVNDFFEDYSPTSEDAKKIIEIIIDLDCYNVLKYLRISPITKKGIMKVSDNIKNLNMVLEKIQSIGALKTIKTNEGKEIYFLITDLRIQKFFPDYILNIILKKYNQNTIPLPILINYLDILKETYQAEKTRSKEEEEKIEKEIIKREKYKTPTRETE